MLQTGNFIQNFYFELKHTPILLSNTVHLVSLVSHRHFRLCTSHNLGFQRLKCLYFGWRTVQASGARALCFQSHLSLHTDQRHIAKVKILTSEVKFPLATRKLTRGIYSGLIPPLMNLSLIILTITHHPHNYSSSSQSLIILNITTITHPQTSLQSTIILNIKTLSEQYQDVPLHPYDLHHHHFRPLPPKTIVISHPFSMW